MSIFKRLSATLVSQIDQVVGEIENHDAVVKATLQDMSRQIAEAKIRLSQVYSEQEKIQQQIKQQQENIERWKQRAIETAKQDQSKALECINKRRQCQLQAEKLQQTLNHYNHSSEKLANDIQTSEQRMAELKHKHTLMRARQSTSQALKSSNEVNSTDQQLMEETFTRWETNIVQDELINQEQPLMEPIEKEFLLQEQHHELQQELQNLLNEEKENE